MNEITINLSEQDRAILTHANQLLAQLIEKLEALGVPHTVIGREELTPPETSTELPQNDEIDQGDIETLFTPEDYPEEPQQAENETPVAVFELTDVMSKVQALIQAGKKDQVKTIVQQYAPNVSSIPADKFSEVMDKLTALEG